MLDLYGDEDEEPALVHVPAIAPKDPIEPMLKEQPINMDHILCSILGLMKEQASHQRFLDVRS